MTTTPNNPIILQLVPLARTQKSDFPDGYRVISLWEEDSLDAVIQAHGNDIVILTTSAVTPTPAALIDRLPNLRAICSNGVGYDSLPVAHAQSKGIQVSNTPDVLNDCVADLAWALILATSRRLGQAERFVRDNSWAERKRVPLGNRVAGKALGIVGLGRIGMEIAQRATGFRMPIRYHNRNPRSDVQWQYEPSLEALAKWADILVIATVGGPSTSKLIDAPIIDALGPDGILINISRGSVIDEAALVQALQDQRLGGAGLDVFENEPHVPDALKQMDNVVVLPHIASATDETRRAMADLVMQNVVSFVNTGKLLTPIAPL